MRRLLRRFRYWILDSQRAKDLAEEMEFHRNLRQRDLEQTGVSAEEAAAMSRRAMGSALRAMEDSRRVWICVGLEQAGQDLRYAARSLSRTPVFTLAATLTIALGVGANTGVFSMVNAVLLKVLPVENPSELVFLQRVDPKAPSRAALFPCLKKLPAATGAFNGLSVYAADELRIEIDGRPEQVMGQVASGNYFQLLGVKPALGRLMNGEDENLSPAIAVISERYWRQRFGGDPAVLGKTISFGGRVFAIAGVTPQEFRGLEPGRSIDVTLPITISGNLRTSSAWWFTGVFARLGNVQTKDQAQAASNVVFQSCMTGDIPRNPGSPLDYRLELRPAARGMDSLRRRFSDPLYALTGIVAMVLMLATANIANLLLVRGIARRREFAIRLATGAGRARLARQLLTETLLLFGFGAIPGVLFANRGVAIIAGVFAQGRRPITLDAQFDWRVLAFSITITLLAGLLSTMFPVWRAFRTDPERAIREGQTRTSESGGTAMLARALVALQVALSLVLLVAAVTFVQTLANLHDVDTGFRNEQALTMSITLPEGYAQAGKSVESWDRVLEAVRQVPAVKSAGVSTFTPLSGRDPGGTAVRVRGRPGEEYGSLLVNQVSDGYFETLGVRLLRGRLLSAADANDAPKVALINESAVEKLFGSRDPIGELLEFGKAGVVESAYRIVGVVEDTKHRNLRESSPPFAFVPTRQPRNAERRVTLVVAAETPGGPETLLQPIRNRIANVDPGLMVSDVITIQQQLESTLLAERLLSGLSGAFGLLALSLAAVGLYGVLSYRVGQQRRAIGIRLALGASPSSVAFHVLGRSGLVVAAGLICGLPFAFLVSRAAGSMLWGVKSSDPRIYLACVLTLCVVGLFSSFLPARHAAGIEPRETLQHD